MNLEHINLSEKDFQMIIAGLDQLPHKNDVGEMMGELLIGALSKGEDDTHMEKVKRDRELRMKQKSKEKELMMEEIKILQGKLLMLKRYLIENNILTQSTNIINHIS